MCQCTSDHVKRAKPISPEGRMLYRLMASATPNKGLAFGGDARAGLALDDRSSWSVSMLPLHSKGHQVSYGLAHSVTAAYGALSLSNEAVQYNTMYRSVMAFYVHTC